MTVTTKTDTGPCGPSLSTFAGGGLEERWQVEFRKALENIEDPNTDPKAPRTITIQVVIRPDETRNVGAVGISASVKLSAQKRVTTWLHMGRTAEGLRALEHNPQQLTFGEVAAPAAPAPTSIPANVSPFGAGKKAQ